MVCSIAADTVTPLTHALQIFFGDEIAIDAP